MTAATALTRRAFLGACGGGAAAAAVLLAACTSATPPPATPGGDRIRDLRLIRLGARVELAMVAGYAAALAASSGSGRLAPAPAAFIALARTAAAHHGDHAAAFNGTLAANASAAETVADPVLATLVQEQMAAAHTVSDVATILRLMESTSMQTGVALAAGLSDPGARRQVMLIAPVEAAHAAVLGFLLGGSPVPDAVVGSALARTTTDLSA